MSWNDLGSVSGEGSRTLSLTVSLGGYWNIYASAIAVGLENRCLQIVRRIFHEFSEAKRYSFSTHPSPEI